MSGSYRIRIMEFAWDPVQGFYNVRLIYAREVMPEQRKVIALEITDILTI